MSPASDLAETRLPDTEMALIIFNERVIEQVDFGVGQRAVVEKLRQIGSDTKYQAKSVRGKSAIYDALLAGVRLLDTPTSADVLYLVSDGQDNASHVHVNELTRLLTSSGVRLYIALVHDMRIFHSRTPENLDLNYRVRDLDDIANKTGGEMISPLVIRGLLGSPKGKLEPFGVTMYDFYRRMFNNYLLEAEFPEPMEKHRSWELKLSQEKRKQWKDSTITYPAELSGCLR